MNDSLTKMTALERELEKRFEKVCEKNDWSATAYLQIGRNEATLMLVDDESILGPYLLAIGNATYYEFGILSSDAHMAWLRAVGYSSAGLFDYTPDRVYNTFPWPDRDKLTDAQRAAVENAARQIEAARSAYDDFEFGKDYPTDAMPPDIAEAHKANDRAVRAAYGLPEDASEGEVMSFLMKRYAELVEADKSKPVNIFRERPRPSTRWRRG